MSLISRFVSDSMNRNCWLQCRQFATSYTKTLNMPVTKFPAYVKKNKRLEHDATIREVEEIAEHSINEYFKSSSFIHCRNI